MGNLFQNGPQYVRQIPALVGDMKMLLVRRCPKDPARKHCVPFLAPLPAGESPGSHRAAGRGGRLLGAPAGSAYCRRLRGLSASGELAAVRRHGGRRGAQQAAGDCGRAARNQQHRTRPVCDVDVDVEDQFQRKAQTWKSFYFAVRAFGFDEELVEPAAPEPGPAGSSAEVCNAEPAEPASSEPGLAVSGSPGAQQVSEYGHAGLGRPSAEVCDAELAEPASSEPGLPSQAAQARSKCPSTGVPAEAASSEPGPTDLGDRDGAQQVPEHAQLLLEDVSVVLEVGSARGHVGVQRRGAR